MTHEESSNCEPDETPSLQIEEPISNARLFVFAVAQLILWAAHAAGLLEVAFALPVIQKDFGVSSAQIQWVPASYMLTWGCFQLIAGRLCDLYGRRRGYMVGCGGYILFNVVSTFMPNLASLNVVRALCGFASALTVPASLGLVGVMYPAGRKRTLAYVAITCGGAAGAAAGELLAGAFIELTRWTWRPCFLATGLICLIPLAVTLHLAPVDAPMVESLSVDWLGAASIGGGLFLFLLTLTLSQTEQRGWSTPYLPALLVASAILLGVFVWRQRLLTHAIGSSALPPPLIPHGLLSWKHRNLLMIYLASACTWAATDSIFVFVSYLYFDVLQLNALEAGLKFSVTFFSGTAAAVVVALTISTVSPRLLMAICCLISSAASIIFAVRKVDWPYWKADLWAFLIIAYGTDATIAAGATIISHTALPEDQSVAASLFQTSCRLGYAVGLAISSLIRNAVQLAAESAGKNELDATLDGLRAAFWTLAGFMLLAALIIAFGMKGWEKLDEEVRREREEGTD